MSPHPWCNLCQKLDDVSASMMQFVSEIRWCLCIHDAICVRNYTSLHPWCNLCQKLDDVSASMMQFVSEIRWCLRISIATGAPSTNLQHRGIWFGKLEKCSETPLGTWNTSSWKTRTWSSCRVNTMVGIVHNQYHGCWYPGDAQRQGISRLGIEFRWNIPTQRSSS